MTAITERLAAAVAGRYRIERHLGEGGMASVYLAEDLKHERKVALKLLKPELAAVLGAERFVQEIKTTAALQHPHILPLFDSGTADGFLFYVMPYVQGETLREKLNRETQFGVDEAVRIARDVADALDYAHRHGVIHRDIKPENILMHDGRPMVADFGIALAVSAAAGGRMTETGLSLGTPHYMSPEQATAEKEISGRSDVYSLGSVLYEMLTGNPPHVGASAQQIIMKIITEPPEPVTKFRKSVPPNVAAAVARSLEKLPADRFESAKAFADALGNASFTTANLVGGEAARTGSGWKARAAVPLGVSALLLLIAATWGWVRPTPVAPLTRLDLSIGTITPHIASDVVISPDGSTLAVTGVAGGEPAIFLRRLDGEPDFRKVPGTETASGSPSFSPDGQWIVFRRNSDGALVKVAVAGGGAVTLVPGPAQVFYPHWGTNDLIVYGGPTGFVRIASAGGKGEQLRSTAGAGRYSFLLPDGSGVLFSLNGNVSVHDFATDSTTVLVPNAAHPVYVETGHLLYIAEGGGLFAVPFDLGRRQVTGSPVRVLDRVAAALTQRGYSVSKNGVLVYREGESSVSAAGGIPTRFLIKSLSGATDTIRLPTGRRLMPRFSPDGRSIAYEVLSNRIGETDIHTFELVTGTNTQITFAGDNDGPVWSPDGKRIAFSRDVVGNGEELFVKAADNSGAEQLLLSLPGNQNPTGWVDEDMILFMSSTVGQYDLFTLSPKAGSKPVTYLEAPWNETDLRVSRDRKLAAFVSAEAGLPGDIWLRDFPVAQGKWRVSSRTGSAPRWSPDGNYLYFWEPSQTLDSLFRARIDRSPAVVVRAPELVMALNISGLSNWDIHPDGKRIIVTVDEAPPAPGGAGAAPASRHLVVLNWFTELRALTGKGPR